jgi:hypothetical protein
MRTNTDIVTLTPSKDLTVQTASANADKVIRSTGRACGQTMEAIPFKRIAQFETTNNKRKTKD